MTLWPRIVEPPIIEPMPEKPDVRLAGKDFLLDGEAGVDAEVEAESNGNGKGKEIDIDIDREGIENAAEGIDVDF